jgi:hypothetical protein
MKARAGLHHRGDGNRPYHCRSGQQTWSKATPSADPTMLLSVTTAIKTAHSRIIIPFLPGLLNIYT